jgi:hypothetical protein
MRELWSEAGEEPTIGELLNDPIAKLLRRRDGLQEEDVWLAVEQALCHIAGVRCPLPRYAA